MPSSDTETKSSLQRLLALDKSFETFEQRLEEAARILDIYPNLEYVDSDTQATKGAETLSHGNYGRHEYVLRWILGKLKSEADARSTFAAWSLVWHVIQDMSLASCVRVLGSIDVMSSIITALAELFPIGLLDATSELYISAQPDLHASSTIDSENDKEEKKSKKRKRANKEVEDASLNQRRNSDVAYRRARSFYEIAMLVRKMVSLSTGSGEGHEATLRHRMRSVLRMDGEKRMQFMKHWIIALAYPAARHYISESSIRSLTRDTASMFQVWQLQPLPASSEREALTRQFAKECEWPLFLLLCQLRSFKSGHAEVDLEDLARIVHQLEQLFAQQILLPARSLQLMNPGTAYHANGSPDPPMSFRGYFDPICANIDRLSKAAERDQERESLLATALQGLPHILDMALRATRLDTPKRKQTEMLWIDALFAILHPMIRRASAHVGGGRSPSSNRVLVDLLDVLERRKLSLSADTIVKIVDRHCELSKAEETDESPKRPDFAVIAKVLALDATVFTSTSQGSNGAARSLFTTLGRHAWTTKDTHTGPEERGCQSSMQILCRDQIAAPLMRAFARTRNIRQYITLWRGALEYMPDNNSSWTLWTDPALAKVLRDLLEASLTTDQIRDLLVECTRPLQDTVDRYSDGRDVPSSEVIKVHHGNVLLHAVLVSTHSDSLKDQLFNEMSGIIDLFEQYARIIPKDDRSYQPQHDFFWECLVRLNEICFPLWNSDVAKDQSSEIAEWHVKQRQCLNYAWRMAQAGHEDSGDGSIATDFSHMQRGPLTYIIQMCDTLVRGVHPQNQLRQQINRLLDTDYEAAETKDKAPPLLTQCQPKSILLRRTITMSYILAQYPGVWEQLPSVARHDLLRQLLSPMQHGSTDPRASAAVAACRHLISMLIDKCSKSARLELLDALVSVLVHEATNAKEYRHKTWAELVIDAWPSLLLPSERCGTIVESVIDLLESSAQSDVLVIDQARTYVSLLAKLTETPAGAFKLMSSPDSLWRVANQLDTLLVDGDDETDAIFTHICGCVFDRLVYTQDKSVIESRPEIVKTHAARLEGLLNTRDAKTGSQTAVGAKMLLCSAFVTFTKTPTVVSSKLTHTLLKSNIIRHFSERLLVPNLQQRTPGARAEVFKAFSKVLLAFWDKSAQPTAHAIEKEYFAYLARAESVEADVAAIGSSSGPESCAAVMVLLLGMPDCDAERLLRYIQPLVFLLRWHVSPSSYAAMQDAFKAAVATLTETDKLAVLEALLTATGKDRAEANLLANSVLASVSRQQLVVSDLLSKASSLFTGLVMDFESEVDYRVHTSLARSIITVVREKPFLVNQYNLESLLSCMNKLASPSSATLPSKRASTIYLELCTIMQSLLQFHRSSLGGRIHLLLPVLTQLMACLFIPHRGASNTRIFRHPPWLAASQLPLTTKHAQRFARLLTLLCNPPQSTISGHRSRRSKSAELVDETRKLRSYVGQYAQHVVHAFCRMLLHGRLGEGMREGGLMAGLWAVFDVMDMGGDGAVEEQRVKVLGASMNKAELALLRREYEGWKRFGAWKGG